MLCEHNPHRRCNVNFAPKYLVNDVLKAKCEAPIRVEIIDRATGVPVGDDIPDVHLEVRTYLPAWPALFLLLVYACTHFWSASHNLTRVDCCLSTSHGFQDNLQAAACKCHIDHASRLN